MEEVKKKMSKFTILGLCLLLVVGTAAAAYGYRIWNVTQQFNVQEAIKIQYNAGSGWTAVTTDVGLDSVDILPGETKTIQLAVQNIGPKDLGVGVISNNPTTLDTAFICETGGLEWEDNVTGADIALKVPTGGTWYYFNITTTAPEDMPVGLVAYSLGLDRNVTLTSYSYIC